MSVTDEEIKMLSAEFDRADIHWRAQTLTKDGTKAMALAYIDARNVMDRLDQIVGVANWQDRYEFHGSRTVCYLSIKVGEEWITKADGAGDTAVEGEKGSISDALKRAAVKWGIGRYLYALPAPWVPCESYKANRGGKEINVWKAWKADPWDFVKGAPTASKANSRDAYQALVDEARSQTTLADLEKWKDSTTVRARYASLPSDWKATFTSEIRGLKKALEDAKVITA